MEHSSGVTAKLLKATHVTLSTVPHTGPLLVHGSWHVSADGWMHWPHRGTEGLKVVRCPDWEQLCWIFSKYTCSGFIFICSKCSGPKSKSLFLLMSRGQRAQSHSDLYDPLLSQKRRIFFSDYKSSTNIVSGIYIIPEKQKGENKNAP